MKAHVIFAALVLATSSSYAQSGKVKICGRIATEAAKIQETRKMLDERGILYTANSFFEAREEHYKRKLENVPEAEKADMEKAVALGRGMDVIIANNIFQFPSMMTPTFAADHVHSVCMNMSAQELLGALKLE